MKSEKQSNHSSDDLSARSGAYDILSRLCGGFTPLDSPKRVLPGKHVANMLIEDHFRAYKLHERDKGLLNEIVHGVLRHLLTLDCTIKSFSNRPLRNIHSAVFTALRIGTYQLIFLDRIPSSAAVNESVKLIKQRVSRASASFTNAVLRAITRSIVVKTSDAPSNPTTGIYRPAITDAEGTARTLEEENWCCFDRAILPDPSSDKAGYISANHSHPRWLIERWLSRFGEAFTIRTCKVNNLPPPIFLRVNRLKTTRDALLKRFENNGSGILAEEGGNEHSIRLVSKGSIHKLPGFTEGLFQVQDESAIGVIGLLEAKPGERVLDLCAAPGGKTTHIAEKMKDRGEIVAVDVCEKRIAKIRENCDRLDINSVKLLTADGATIGDCRPAQFDRALVDAPCSNTGVLRRRVEARWRLTPEIIGRLSELQYNLVVSGFRALKPHGTLVYSTCSLEPEENEGIVSRLQRENGGAVKLEDQHYWFPQLQEGDGGYAAKLRKS